MQSKLKKYILCIWYSRSNQTIKNKISLIKIHNKILKSTRKQVQWQTKPKLQVNNSFQQTLQCF